jgi:hypothetical protein
VNPTPSWVNGASETVWDYGTTRAVLVTHYNTPGDPASGIWCQEFFIDYQIPLAMLDATSVGGPAVTPDTPFCASFASANSLTNPLQKDVVLADGCVYTGDPSEPLPCGDVITMEGGTQPQSLVNDISATGCSRSSARTSPTR